MYTSLVFDKYIQSYNHYHKQDIEHFYHPPQSSFAAPFAINSSHSSPWQPLTWFIPYILPLLECHLVNLSTITFLFIPFIYNFIYNFTTFVRFIHAIAIQHFIHLYWCIVFHCLPVSQHVCFNSCWTFGKLSFGLLWIIFVWIYAFLTFEWMQEMKWKCWVVW